MAAGAGRAKSESDEAGALHAANLGRSRAQAGPEPNDPRYSSVTRARDAKARTALRRQEATSKDLGLRLCLA